MYQLSTGRSPFSAKDTVKRSRQILNGEIEPFPANIELHIGLKQLIIAML